jgi:hypothetical protein
MTDFFTRMARSALGLTPVAKVLAASRYAPGQGMPEQAFEETLEPQTVAGLTPAADANAAPAPDRHGVEVQRARPLATVARRAAATMAATARASSEGVKHAHPLVAQEGVHDDARPQEPALPRPPASTLQPLEESRSVPRGEDAGAAHRAIETEPIEHSVFVRTGEDAARRLYPNASPLGAPWPHPSASPLGAPWPHRAPETEPIEDSVFVRTGEDAARRPRPSTSPLAAPWPHRALEREPIEDSVFVGTGEGAARRPHPSPSPLDTPEPRQPRAPSAALTPAEVSLANALSPRSFASPLPARRDEMDGETPAAPVIRVTIGRVEVRTAPPPPPAEPLAPPAPRLSLDDYLRSHNGRAR